MYRRTSNARRPSEQVTSIAPLGRFRSPLAELMNSLPINYAKVVRMIVGEDAMLLKRIDIAFVAATGIVESRREDVFVRVPDGCRIRGQAGSTGSVEVFAA